MSTHPEVAERLPLWKNLYEELMAAGVKHGDTFPTELFEQKLRAKRDSIGFSIAVSDLRRALERHGMHISSRGQMGAQYVIIPAVANCDVMQSYARRAADALKRGVILGTATPLTSLSPDDRRRHESTLEKIAMKAALIQRSSQVARVVNTHKPKLITPDSPSTKPHGSR